MSSEAITYLRKELTKLRDDLSRAIDRGMDPRTHATAMDVVRAMYARLDVALLIEREQRAKEARSQPTVAAGAPEDPFPAEDLTSLVLVPVEVFGADCQHDGCEDPHHAAYGISDAVSPWSDCNRAAGRIYRVEDLPDPMAGRLPGDVLTIWARKADVPWFERRFGDGGGHE